MKRSLFLAVIPILMAACMAGTTLGSRQKYVAQHPGLAKEVYNAILAGEICMGMTRDQVVASLGYPDRVHEDTYQSGTRTQFCYDQIGANFNFNRYHYVYFENDRVTSWSQ